MTTCGAKLIGALTLALSLAACGDRASGAKTDLSSAERVAEALDICAEGRGEFAQHLCQNQALAQLDTEVRQTLVAEAASVSDAGAQLLVENQNRWREARRIACGIIEPEAEPSPEQQQCLEQEFRARLADAESVVEEMGGYVFQRMELVDATPVTAEIASNSGLGDEAPAAVVRDIRFPRIDGRQTPEIQRFNDLVAQQPQFRLEDITNEVVDYRIVYAGPELISVRFDMSADTLGAAHGNNSSKAVTVLMSEGRALAAADVFRADAGWQDFLTERSMAALTGQFSDYEFSPSERDVRESATKPHLWLVSEEGLTILFPPYSFGGPYALGGAEVTLPWSDLRRYLNPAAPAPIRPSA